MTFKEFYNKDDHKITKSITNSLGLSVDKMYQNNGLKNMNFVKERKPYSGIASLFHGRRFTNINKLKSVPKKPSDFLARKKVISIDR